jgi:hypothetical protein
LNKLGFGYLVICAALLLHAMEQFYPEPLHPGSHFISYARRSQSHDQKAGQLFSTSYLIDHPIFLTLIDHTQTEPDQAVTYHHHHRNRRPSSVIHRTRYPTSLRLLSHHGENVPTIYHRLDGFHFDGLHAGIRITSCLSRSAE